VFKVETDYLPSFLKDNKDKYLHLFKW
jgi:hypothetical protein